MSNGVNRLNCAKRPLGISNSASIPDVDMGGAWGQTGEKWSANLVFFHVDGVTGGIYLQIDTIFTLLQN